MRPGDYIEFLAETDVLVAASTCPQGDVSVACGTGRAPTCYPLGVQVGPRGARGRGGHGGARLGGPEGRHARNGVCLVGCCGSAWEGVPGMDCYALGGFTHTQRLVPRALWWLSLVVQRYFAWRA